MQRFVSSKWKKTKALNNNPMVKAHIPHTRLFQEKTLESMLAKYGMVYVKPDRGTHGKGVIRVEGGPGSYRYQTGLTVRTFTTSKDLYQSLKNITGNRTYVVQKGIHLLKHKGRRFDIRVMVQHNTAGRWEQTGMIGRVAAPQKIVTNFHNGGQLKPVPALMSPYMGQSERKAFEAKLRSLGLSVARHLEARYPGIKEVGLDVAVDRNNRPWILEVNTCPDPYIFRALPNKAVYRKVIRYAKAYGRIRGTRKK